MKKNAISKKAEQLKDLIIENLDSSVQITSEIKIGSGTFDFGNITFTCHCDADDNYYDVCIGVPEDDSEFDLSFCLSGDWYYTQGRYAEELLFDNIDDCSKLWYDDLNEYVEHWNEQD